MVECNSYIAIFSPPMLPELFYVCKVLDFGVADQSVEYEFNHVIPVGIKYIKR